MATGGGAGSSGSGGHAGSGGTAGSGNAGSGSTGGSATGGRAGSGGTGGASGAGGSAGRGGSAGVGGNAGMGGGGPDDAGVPCGGILARQCPADSYCSYEPGDCKMPDAAGVCKTRPRICPLVCNGACGCDGKSYCNVCEAQKSGVDATKLGVCTDAGLPP